MSAEDMLSAELDASRVHDVIGDERPRCEGCNKLLAELVTRPWTIKCVRCKTINKKD
jgi:hypothetical protein